MWSVLYTLAGCCVFGAAYSVRTPHTLAGYRPAVAFRSATPSCCAAAAERKANFEDCGQCVFCLDKPKYASR